MRIGLSSPMRRLAPPRFSWGLGAACARFQARSNSCCCTLWRVLVTAIKDGWLVIQVKSRFCSVMVPIIQQSRQHRHRLAREGERTDDTIITLGARDDWMSDSQKALLQLRIAVNCVTWTLVVVWHLRQWRLAHWLCLLSLAIDFITWMDGAERWR